jgi:hypothetical protein
MSAIGFLGSGVLESLLTRSTQSNTQKLKQTYAQLGQDLQSGNVTQAESDLAGLQAGFASTQPLSSSSPSAVTQAFNQIGQDLRSGNLTAAQSDYASLQQNLQQSGHPYHSHRFGSHEASAQLQQELSLLGQALQGGNTAGAQQAYAALQTDLSAFGVGSSASGGSALNVAV